MPCVAEPPVMLAWNTTVPLPFSVGAAKKFENVPAPAGGAGW